jgi:glucan-binding YG repeat protein
MMSAVEEALEVFNRTQPRKATKEELIAAFNALETACGPMETSLDERYDYYEELKVSSNRGGSSGGGGGSGSGSSSKPFNVKNPVTYNSAGGSGNNGVWQLVDASKNKWSFVLNGGISLSDSWAKLDYTSNGVTQQGWYHFNKDGLMDVGWYSDENGDWYYCNEENDGWYGIMQTGWHLDSKDGHWYYLDPETGKMAKGWVIIDGKWYYFTTQNTQETYTWQDGMWQYLENGARPLGSLFTGEQTPDGYSVDANGAWMN